MFTNSYDLGFIWAGESSVSGYKRNAWYQLSLCHLSTKEKLSLFRDLQRKARS